MNRRYLGPLIGIAVFAGFFFYNQRQESFIQWNDRLLEVIAPLQPNSFEVETAIEPWFAGEPIDVHTTEHTLEHFSETLALVREKLETMPPPNEDPTATAFHETVGSYVEHFQQAHDLYDEIIASARITNPPTPELINPIQQQLFKMIEDGGLIVVRLQSTQQAFAKKHGFRLE